MFQFITNAVAGLFGFAQRQVDRALSPQKRQQHYKQATDFATARPLLATFILTQLSFSLIPILLFLAFSLSALLLAASAALLFALFWAGLALAVLVPVLCLTSSVALCAWASAAACFVAGRATIAQLQSLLPPEQQQQRQQNQQQVEAGGETHPPPAAGSPATIIPTLSPAGSEWAKIESQEGSEQPMIKLEGGEAAGEGNSSSSVQPGS